MNPYLRLNAVEKIDGYVVPRPGEALEKAFARAKAECATHIRKLADAVDATDHATYTAVRRRAISRQPRGHEAVRNALTDLMEQLEGIGIAIPGEEEGQWHGTEGLSFAAAYCALGAGVVTSSDEPTPIDVRLAKALVAFERYAFGGVVVEETGGFEWVSPAGEPPAEFTRVVYVRNGGDAEATSRLSFTVRFDDKGDVIDTCALDLATGAEVGHACV